jgi:predicted TIM-barrel fold metal-dependent hydrolase
MIVDHQHHYTPGELVKPPTGDDRSAEYTDGNPSYTFNPLIDDLDAHIAAMDAGGVDMAVLSCSIGMDNPDLAACRLINDRMRQAEERFPGRIRGLAHVPVTGDGLADELARCRNELGFAGAVTTSEPRGMGLDDPGLDPYYAKVSDLGMYLFVHPLLTSLSYKQLDGDYDLQRSVGREFSLATATVRLINGGVLDRFPDLTVQMSHLGGGIAAILGRVRRHQDKAALGIADDPRHGRLPERDFMHYLGERLIFDTSGNTGEINSVKAALLEIPAARIVFATDYPQEIDTAAGIRGFVNAIRGLGADGETILSGADGRLFAA